MTDDYLGHHLHTTTSIFSPSIASSQLAWFLISGSGAHSLPTCAFYFVLYELKPVDILYMKLIHERVNLVPIITKADTLSQKELWVLKKRMIRQLKLNGINFHTFGLDLATVEKMTEQRQWGAAPFVVSTRRDRDGNLFQSDLQQLVKMCLYERLRHLQEDAVHKVIAWREAFGPSDIPPTTQAERFWGARANGNHPATMTPVDTHFTGLQSSPPPLLEAQSVSQQHITPTLPPPLTFHNGNVAVSTYSGATSPTHPYPEDVAVGLVSPRLLNANATISYVPATSYAPSSRPDSVGSASQARLNFMLQTTGMTVDSSTRPNVIMGENSMNTVQTLAQGSFVDTYYSPGKEEHNSLLQGHSNMGGEQGFPFKVEVPNSILSYQPAMLPTAGGIGSPPSSENLADIWEAVELGDLAAVQRHLNSGTSPDQRNSSRSTLLHRAAWQRNKPFPVMGLLISHGANVNLTNENGNTVLQNILMKHDDPMLLKLLLDNGAESTILNKEGMNTLEVAALFNRLESTEYLLENDILSSEPESIANALQRARGPDKKATKALLRSWQGKEGEKKRADLIERIQNPGLNNHPTNKSQVQLQENKSVTQFPNQSQTQIPDGMSVNSFDTNKGGDGPSDSSSMAGSQNEGQEYIGASTGPPSSSTSSTQTSHPKHAGRFNLKTMRAAAPSMNNLFGRKS
ncbi:hypothetical protein BGZ58_001667 [Dissophora ornata]|nr:hypothetical protein BGZ58_001667 [Dissophora ornata]